MSICKKESKEYIHLPAKSYAFFASKAAATSTVCTSAANRESCAVGRLITAVSTT